MNKGVNKMKKKLKKLEWLNNVPIMILIVLLGFGIGAISRNVLQPKEVVEVKSDVLPLENGGEVVIKIVDNQKRVYISYEDLEYISKKKSKMKKLVSNLGALYERLA
jgi:hypothetical protein